MCFGVLVGSRLKEKIRSSFGKFVWARRKFTRFLCEFFCFSSPVFISLSSPPTTNSVTSQFPWRPSKSFRKSWLRPVKGVLSMAMAAAKQGLARLLVPLANAREAAVVQAVQVHGVAGLAEAAGVLSGQVPFAPVAAETDEVFARLNSYDVD